MIVLIAVAGISRAVERNNPQEASKDGGFKGSTLVLIVVAESRMSTIIDGFHRHAMECSLV